MSELIFVKQKDKDCIINVDNVEYIARHNDNEAYVYFQSGGSFVIDNYDELKEYLEEKRI